MRRTLLLFAALLALGFAAPAHPAEVVVVHIHDTIQPASQRYLERGLDEAARRDASLAIVELDTPGGLMSSMREMVTAITTSPVPVAVYVTPAGAQAASAGFFLLMAADIAAMAPGTNTGAAHPVGGQGKNLPEDVRLKATNDAAAMIRSLTKPRDRNVELAEKAITESLSFSADEAHEKNLVEVVEPDLPALIKALDGREVHRFSGEAATLELKDAIVTEVPPSRAEELLSVLANPNIAYILMAIGMLGIYMELAHPGAVLPGVVGAIALLLALFSMSVLPVNLVGVALMLVALVLFILEVKVTSYGLLTVGGLIAFVLGSLMLFDAPIPDMRVSLSVILPTAVVLAGVVIFLLTRVVRVHRTRPATGREGMVGEVGEVRVALAPEGTVRVHGEWWVARSSGSELPVGTRVRVTRVDSFTLEVEPIDGSEGERRA